MNTIAVKTNPAVFDEQGVEKILAFAERSINASTDIAEDATTVLSLASKESYQAKIEVITHAEDLSTKEKLDAIKQAEEKCAQDVQNGVTTCKDLLWNRYLLVFSCITGIVLLATSPEGSKAVKSILKRIA